MRVLLAMQISTGTWFLRAEPSETKAATTFRDELAANFAVAAGDIAVTVAENVTPATFTAVQRVLERGYVSGPDAVVWPPNDPDASLVHDAATVDAVTAARRRRLLGSVDEQLAHLWLSVHYAQINVLAAWPDGRVVTAQEKAEASAHLLKDRVVLDQLERVSAEGRALKASKSWI